MQHRLAKPVLPALNFTLILALCLLFGYTQPSYAQSGTAPSSSDAPDNGLILTESGYDVDETVTRLVATLEDRGLTVMGTVNHGANAASVDKELLPTQVIIFGNPNLGTPLMQNSRSVAIDLPQKYLVWEDSSGRTFVTYNSVSYLADRHGITGPEEVLNTVTGALANFAGSVAPAIEEEPAAEEPAAEEPAAEEPAAEEPAAEEPAAEEPVSEESAPVQAEPAPAEEPSLLPVTGNDSSIPSLPWVLLAALLVGALLFVMPSLKMSEVRKSLAKNKIVGLLLFGMLTTLSIGLPASLQADGHSGLIATDSPYSVDDTVERLQAAMESRNLKVMMVIDHAANAAKVEKELPPTQVIIFGNPNVGTGLMQANRSIAIDLPQKMLVWDDGDGNVQIIYNDPAYLVARHAITTQDQVVANVTGAFEAIVAEVTAEE